MNKQTIWPKKLYNKLNNNEFVPQNEEVREAVAGNKQNRIIAIQGGEGSGKTITGFHLIMNKLKDGMDGVVISPSMTSLKGRWDFMRNWIPEEIVIPEDRHKLGDSYMIYKSFKIDFYNEKGGVSSMFMYTQSSYKPSLKVSWVWIDDAQMILTKDMLGESVSTARIEIDNKIPQVIVGYTLIPNYRNIKDQDNWLYRCFGDEEDLDDPLHFVKGLTDKIELSLR